MANIVSDRALQWVSLIADGKVPKIKEMLTKNKCFFPRFYFQLETV